MPELRFLGGLTAAQTEELRDIGVAIKRCREAEQTAASGTLPDYLELLWTGSRNHPSPPVVVRELERQRRVAWDSMRRLFVAVGCCRTGVDDTIHKWCRANLREQDWVIYKADWKRHRKAAGPIRNRDMIKAHPNAKGLRAFPLRGRWQDCKGTWDCVTAAVDAELPVVIIPPDAPRFTLTTIAEAKEAMR